MIAGVEQRRVYESLEHLELGRDGFAQRCVKCVLAAQGGAPRSGCRPVDGGRPRWQTVELAREKGYESGPHTWAGVAATSDWTRVRKAAGLGGLLGSNGRPRMLATCWQLTCGNRHLGHQGSPWRDRSGRFAAWSR